MAERAAAFSVLMPVYAKEQPGFFSDALGSVFEQSCPPDEVVVVKDGPLTDPLEAVLAQWAARCPGCLKLVGLPAPAGLGLALAVGVEACTHPLVARMDSDDLSVPDRFERQLAAFAADGGLDIVGGQIAEFAGQPQQAQGRREVPLAHGDILRFARRRNPFNHMTVMFKKQSVLAAGNYRDAPGAEDYDLWGRMLAWGARAANLDACLVYARTGSGFFRRRHGWQYLKAMLRVRWRIHRLGLSGRGDFLISCLGLCVTNLAPQWLKRLLYRVFLRTG